MRILGTGSKIWLLSLIIAFLFSPQANAQTPPGRFTRYWRNFFETKASWPTLRVTAGAGDYIFGMGMAALMGTSGGLAGSMVGIGMVGPVCDAVNANMAGVGIRPPDPPRILSLEATPQGVNVLFNDPSGAPDGTFAYQLLHFESANSVPRVVDILNFEGSVGSDGWILTDPFPPTSGSSFYAMTKTRNFIFPEDANQVMIPWWSLPLSGSDVGYLTWFSKGKFRITSDYSAPAVYTAGVKPDLGDIDAIAVANITGDIYVSRPGARKINKIENQNNSLGQETNHISISFRMPGQKGLGIDRNNNLFTDNAASDDQFGGRLFKFDASNAAMTFTGTVNYFSQMLMFANPVSVGTMVSGPDNSTGARDDLYVFDALSREIKRVPVNADYEAGRRVGLPYYRYSEFDSGIPIALDVQSDNLGRGKLYLLDNNSIKGIPLGQTSIPGIATESFSLK
jgi:hypothetical protein